MCVSSMVPALCYICMSMISNRLFWKEVILAHFLRLLRNLLTLLLHTLNSLLTGNYATSTDVHIQQPGAKSTLTRCEVWEAVWFSFKSAYKDQLRGLWNKTLVGQVSCRRNGPLNLNPLLLREGASRRVDPFSPPSESDSFRLALVSVRDYKHPVCLEETQGAVT